MKLAVISSLDHYRGPSGFVCGSAAAAREIDALASIADEVVHVACLHRGDPPAEARSYEAPIVRLELLPPAGGRSLAGKLAALLAMPRRIAAIQRAWRDADAALIRCPSNVAAAAMALAAPGCSPPRVWIKYTGPWQGRSDEPWGYRLQRLWLRSGLSGATVSVGGVDESPGGGAQTVCNPSLNLAEVLSADLMTRAKMPSKPWRLLCVGRLVEHKGVDLALRTLAAMGGHAELDIAGDGPARAELQRQAEALGVAPHVRFHGGLSAGALDLLYREAHVLLAPSFAEGWSRAWTEAAARRCVPMASNVGAAPGLETAGAGLVIPLRDPAVWARGVQSLLEDPPRWRRLADRGPSLAHAFTYERFAEEARAILRPEGTNQVPAVELL